jgi:hypothetical protein
MSRHRLQPLMFAVKRKIKELEFNGQWNTCIRNCLNTIWTSISLSLELKSFLRFSYCKSIGELLFHCYNTCRLLSCDNYFSRIIYQPTCVIYLYCLNIWQCQFIILMQNWNEVEWYVEDRFYFDRSYVLKILGFALLWIFPLVFQSV